jgi:hypothetical protein
MMRVALREPPMASAPLLTALVISMSLNVGRTINASADASPAENTPGQLP